MSVLPFTGNTLDGILIAISWSFTILFIFVAVLIKFIVEDCRISSINCTASDIQVNGLLASCVLLAFSTFYLSIGASTWMQPVELLFSWVFVWSSKRIYILLFWTLCLMGSIVFCGAVNFLFTRRRRDSDSFEANYHATTSQRKFFHLTTSLVAISGLFYEPQLLFLASHIVLQIMIVIEALRSLGVTPWAGTLDRWLFVFIDEAQESTQLILTPIFLFVGVFMPILLGVFPFYDALNQLRMLHFAGVQSVGIGDSFAAVIGSRLSSLSRPEAITRRDERCGGRETPSPTPSLQPTKWTGFSRWASGRKSLEGSAAMFAAQLAIMPLICQLLPAVGLAPRVRLNWPALVVSSALNTIVEAHLSLADNIILPLITTIVYYVME